MSESETADGSSSGDNQATGKWATASDLAYLCDYLHLSNWSVFNPSELFLFEISKVWSSFLKKIQCQLLVCIKGICKFIFWEILILFARSMRGSISIVQMVQPEAFRRTFLMPHAHTYHITKLQDHKSTPIGAFFPFNTVSHHYLFPK